MKKTLTTMAGLFLLFAIPAAAQIGTPAFCNRQAGPAPIETTAKTNPNPDSPQYGNGVLGPAYQNHKCGLNYTTATRRLGQRFTPVGAAQPAAFTIAGIPAGAVIEAAFVWSDASGNGIPSFNITVVNPALSSFTMPSTLVGSHIDKCWGYTGSYTYRADVTTTISGNGTYQLSGFPTGTPNDIDGATMMVIWSDPTANFAGDIIIWDGAIVDNTANATLSQTINGFTACTQGTYNARAFLAAGDIQNSLTTATMNGTPVAITAWDWWNYVDVATTVTAGQTSSNFVLTIPFDCINFALAGLYYQSDCKEDCFVPCEAKPDFKWDGCNPVQFYGSNSAPANVVSWFWSFGDNQTSNLQNPLHYYGMPGTYEVCLTIIAIGSDGKTCCEQICYKVDVCDAVPCKVQPDFYYASSITPLQIYLFDATVFSGGTICNYDVDWGDGSPVYSGPTLPPTHTYPVAGSYQLCMTVTVCVYGPNGEVIKKCDDKICKKVVAVGNHDGGKLNNPNTEEFQVFPSPTNTTINIIVGESDQQVTIMSSNGQEVAKASSVGKNSYQADVSNLAPGVYFVIVKAKDGSVRKETFIKE